jgi:methionyl-tRNA formyltransferase
MAAGEMPAPWRVLVVTESGAIARGTEQAMAARGHRVVGLLTSAQRDPGYVDVVSGATPGVDVLVSSHPRRWAAMLAPLRLDLIVCALFPWRLPAETLALPRLGAINVHPTLLPAYRGTDTPYWMLRNGERQWGVTMHRMAPDFDSGPILAQAAFEASDDDTVATIMPRIFGAVGQLWDVGLARLAAGDPGDAQDEARASYVGRVADLDAWRRVDWSLPARQVHNVVRSCAHFRNTNGAVALLDGAPVTILRTQLVPETEQRTAATPGAVLSRDDGGVLVQCGDGPLRVLEMQLEDQ